MNVDFNDLRLSLINDFNELVEVLSQQNKIDVRTKAWLDNFRWDLLLLGSCIVPGEPELGQFELSEVLRSED